MKRVQTILCTSMLIAAIASTALAGNITTLTAAGNITTAPGNITTKPDNITTLNIAEIIIWLASLGL